jgi:hypothetical protein
MRIYKLTNPQKIIGVAALAVTAGVSFLLTLQTSDLASSAAESETKIVTREVKLQIPMNSISTVEFAKTETVPAHVNVQAVAAAPKPAAQLPAVSSWQMGDIKTQTPKITLSEKISAYAIVELEQHPATFPAVGEQIQLPMLNGQKVIASVQSITTSPNGDYTWSGHLEGYGDDYPVVMTYGEHSIFATITTPEGSYTMESLDGLGWLYKNPAEIELSNPGAKDFLEVNAIQ